MNVKQARHLDGANELWSSTFQGMTVRAHALPEEIICWIDGGTIGRAMFGGMDVKSVKNE